MFGLFEPRDPVARAKKQLQKIDKKRAYLLKIINGHFIYEEDVISGTYVRKGNVTYQIRSEGFGLFNLYTNNGYMDSQVLPESMTRYDLTNELNVHDFRMG